MGKRVDTAAWRAPAHHARRAPLRYLPLVGLLLATWACGGTTANITITHRPASELRLALNISGQYSNTPTVQILVYLFEAKNQQPVFLAAHARLTCNGIDIAPSAQSFVHPCPRQAPGGVYHIAYTDERGVTTTMTVPIPVGVFAMLSPRPGALVPIPTNGALQVRFSTPLPPAQASVTIDSVTASCGAAQPSCGVVASGPLDSTVATPSAPPVSGNVVATPDTLSCPPSSLLNNPLATTSGNQETFTLTGDFGMFQPGPGSIALGMEACMTPDRGGFNAARVTFSDSISAPITWEG